MVKESLIDLINDDEELKFLAYSGVVTVWVDAAGKVEKYSVSLEDGSPKIKKLLESLVMKLRFDSGPPIESAGKGVKLRVNSRI